MSENTITIPKGTVTVAMRNAITKALSAESKAILGANTARLGLCIALGAVKTAIEAVEECARGGFKYYIEKHFTGRLSYSPALKYAKVGQADDPSEAFNAYKLKDAKAAVKSKESKIAAAVAAAVETTTPSETKRHDSEAGDDTAVAPTMDEAANAAKSSLEALVLSNVTGDQREQDKRVAMGQDTVREMAAAVGLVVPDATSLVLRVDDEPATLVNWLEQNWNAVKCAKLTAIFTASLARAETDPDVSDDIDTFARKVMNMTDTNGSRAPKPRKSRAAKAKAAAESAIA